MKKIIMLCLMATSLMGLYGCNRENSAVQPEEDVLALARVGAQASGQLSSSAIAPISASALPSTVTTYIAGNYAGYTVERAAKGVDGSFLVIIRNAAKDHKALVFGADGAFKQEVAFMGGRGKGPNGPGGPHERGPRSFTAIDVASLPATITGYVTSKYASSTISGAAQNAEKLYVVFVKTTTGRVLLEFNADGTFKQEVTRGDRGRGSFTEVTATDLPQTVKNYIATNYAGSTVRRAAKSNIDGGFLVWISKADGTNVALSFGADGVFKQAITCTRDQKPTT